MEFIPGVFEVLQPSAPKERMTALEKKCAIRMENITKRFGSKVIANKDVNLELYEGEILSLLGENGSGKTTLMNMLSGIYFPDEGQIYIHGEPVTIASPKDAFEHGIGMIHQHFKLVDLFTATENIILGLEGKLDIAEASKKVKEICDKYGFDIDPNQKIYDMSVSEKQTVEIIKLNGSIELAPIVGLSEVICDIVETGSTLRENGLVVLEEVCPLSARMVVNQVSMKMDNERITKLISDLKTVIK